jgi:ribosomal protein S27AE
LGDQDLRRAAKIDRESHPGGPNLSVTCGPRQIHGIGHAGDPGMGDIEEQRTCPNCGEPVADTDTVCPNCGETLVGG